MIHILIVEDEKPISNLIRLSLTKEGYHCTCAFDGAEAADLLEEHQYDLILLDVMLPEIDGFELMDYIRPLEIPVIFLTAKGAVQDRVKGLKLGAEDYIVKPFETIELLARIDVILRRYKKCNMVLEVGGLRIDTGSMQVWREGEEVSLTKTEYELLLLFARNPRRAMYRETIYERVWGEEYPFGSKAVDLHVQRLRKKVGWERCLQAVNRVGYRLEVEGVKFHLKMTLSMLALLSLLFGIGGSLLISASFRDSLEREKKAAFNDYRMAWGTLQIVNSLDPYLDQTAIAQTMEQLCQQNDTSWTELRLSTAEEVIYESGAPQPAWLQVSWSRESPEPGDCLFGVLDGREGRRYLVFSGAVETNGDVLYLTTSHDISTLYTARQAQQQAYLQVFLLMCLLCGALSYTVSRVLTAPLEGLSRAARAIASGNYASRVRVRSEDEIGMLSEDFNAMAEQLEAYITRLQQSVERQERFVGSFAHEMKTPMTSLIGYAELIRGGTLTAEEQTEAAGYLYSEGKRLESLSRKLLELLVIQRQDLPLAEVSPGELIRELARRLGPPYQACGIVISWDCEEGTCLLEPDLVWSLLLNLADNGKKAMEGGGELHFQLRMLEDGCRIRVLDTGRGIPPQALEHLTEAFYRVDKARSRKQGGFGLGLALCQEIAALHNGSLRFGNRAEGGACVTVELRGGRP